MAWLYFFSGPLQGQSFPVRRPVTRLGRHPDCEIVLPHISVSNYQARIECDGDDYFVEDTNSRNGTAVNGTLITTRTPLRDGDLIEITEFHARFQLQGAPVEPGVPPAP